MRSGPTTRRPTGRPHSLSKEQMRREREAAKEETARLKGGSAPSTRRKAPWTQPAGSTKKTLRTFEPNSRFSRKGRRPKKRVGKGKRARLEAAVATGARFGGPQDDAKD